MTISAPVRDLLQLALGSFPRSQAEKDRSRALLRCAYRGRTRKVRLSIVENCGGPGSGKPGPCPEPDKIKVSTPREGIRPQYSEADILKDKSGNPINVFHGSEYKFEDFRDGVTYFSPNPGYSYVWKSPHVYEAEIALKNPYRTENLSDVEGAAYQPEWVEELKKKGYDGILYSKKDNLLKGPSGWGDDRPQYVVFSKSQIRLKKRHTNEEFQLGIQLGDIAVNARPIKTDIRINELAPYLHDLLGDVTKRDAKAIARIVKRGVERRWKDSSVARAIVRSTKIEPDRAKVIARTEMSRARTDVGLGKKRDSDKVVFTLGAVDRTCPRCRALKGKVYTVRKAAGVIPVHPNCRCFWSGAPKDARVSNANPKGCNQYSGKGCSTRSKYKILPLDEESSHIESHLEVFGDTHRLASSLPTQVDLLKIRQPAARGKDYDRSIENLASKIRASKSIRPIVLVEDGDEYYTLDGDHRVSAFKKLGEKTIPAMVLVKKSRVSNVFCATGEGGGVDPSYGANGPKQLAIDDSSLQERTR